MTKLKIELSYFILQTTALLAWAWLAATYQTPKFVAVVITVALTASFVKSFERLTELGTLAALGEDDAHG